MRADFVSGLVCGLGESWWIGAVVGLVTQQGRLGDSASDSYGSLLPVACPAGGTSYKILNFIQY